MQMWWRLFGHTGHEGAGQNPTDFMDIGTKANKRAGDDCVSSPPGKGYLDFELIEVIMNRQSELMNKIFLEKGSRPSLGQGRTPVVQQPTTTATITSSCLKNRSAKVFIYNVLYFLV